MKDREELLEHDGDLSTGDEGDPGPTGSSTYLKAPRPDARPTPPPKAKPELRDEEDREPRP
jgi:hypothetical protein